MYVYGFMVMEFAMLYLIFWAGYAMFKWVLRIAINVATAVFLDEDVR